VYESRSEPGGALRSGIPEERLPRSVLNDEIARIRDLGVSMHMNRSLGDDVSLRHLRSRYDAVVIATGSSDSALVEHLGISPLQRRSSRERVSCTTSLEGVYLSGGAVRPLHMAARAVDHGKSVAFKVHRYLGGELDDAPDKRFDLHLGALLDGELEEFLKSASRAPRTIPAAEDGGGFTSEEAAAESKRCLMCGCSAKNSCLLRHYAGEYAATGRRHAMPERPQYRRIGDHPLVDYEPSKCIKCGKCVSIAEKSGESYGLTFSGRSSELRVERSALQCARACPTGALTVRSDRSEKAWKKP
jgi:ferredoxin